MTPYAARQEERHEDEERPLGWRPQLFDNQKENRMKTKSEIRAGAGPGFDELG